MSDGLSAAASAAPIWPAEELRPHIETVARSRAADWPLGRYRSLMAELDAEREAAATIFAQVNRWVYSRRVFRPTALVRASERCVELVAWLKQDPFRFKHTDWLRESARGRVVGTVLHVYPPPRDQEIPGVAVHALPESWYYPRHTYAYLLRPAQEALGEIPTGTTK